MKGELLAAALRDRNLESLFMLEAALSPYSECYNDQSESDRAIIFPIHLC
jgi:hypothetical protein